MLTIDNLGDFILPGPNKLGFYGATPQPKPSVEGARGGNVALASLLSALSSLGLITDHHTTD